LECWSGEPGKTNYKRHGKSDKCTGGTGGPWSSNVYMIKFEPVTKPPPTTKAPNKHLGCFKDSWNRALPKYLNIARTVAECRQKAAANGFKVFAIQNHLECWSGPGAEKTYNKHGGSNACTKGTGGPWANDVYLV